MPEPETFERRMERLYPFVKWSEPVPMQIEGRPRGFGCRFCIAMIGYDVKENKLPGYHETKEETLEHIKQQHLPKGEVMKESVYLKKKPNGELLENEKSPFLVAICDEELHEPPMFYLIPEGLVLVSVVDNGGFEAALVCDNKSDYARVARSWDSIEDERPVRFFLIKREWVRQMADRPLVSDQEGGE